MTTFCQDVERRGSIEWGRGNKNLQFLRLLDKTYVEELRNNTPTLKENTKKIQSKLEKLTVPEQQEWSETMVLKCKGLYRAQMTGDLPTALKTLVSVSTERRIDYDSRAIESILKQFYFDKYGHEVVDLFKKVGFSVAQYQTLSYDDPWYSKLFNSMTSIF